MFEFLRRKKARQQQTYAAGEEAGAAIAEAVETYLGRRLPEVSMNLLSAFQQRLTTIHGEPNHAPEVVAQVEWNIFKKQVDAFPSRMRQEAHEALAKWREVASQIGVLGELEQLVNSRIESAEKEILAASLAALASTCSALKQKNGQA